MNWEWATQPRGIRGNSKMNAARHHIILFQLIQLNQLIILKLKILIQAQLFVLVSAAEVDCPSLCTYSTTSTPQATRLNNRKAGSAGDRQLKDR